MSGGESYNSSLISSGLMRYGNQHNQHINIMLQSHRPWNTVSGQSSEFSKVIRKPESSKKKSSKKSRVSHSVFRLGCYERQRSLGPQAAGWSGLNDLPLPLTSQPCQGCRRWVVEEIVVSILCL